MWLYLTLFGFIRFRDFGVRGPQSGRILPCYFRQDFELFKFSHELYFVESKLDLQEIETSFFHGWNGRHVWLIPVVKLFFYDVIVVKERL